MNDLFESGDAQTQSTNNEAELQEQPRAEMSLRRKEMTHLTGKNESRPLFLIHCSYVDKSVIEMLLQ